MRVLWFVVLCHVVVHGNTVRCWVTCVVALRVLLRYVYRCVTCVVALRVSLRYVCCCVTCVVVLRVSLRYVMLKCGRL